MPVYKLIKNGQVDNVIIADEVDSIRDQYDSIEEIVVSLPVVELGEPVLMIDSNTVRNNLTFSEKVKWDNNSTPTIVTAKIEFANPRTVADATEVLDFLVAEGDISQQSADKIILAAS